MVEQTSGRRGFVKSIVAGLAGAFFALRGAEPVEARAASGVATYNVRIGTPDINRAYENWSGWERFGELESIVNGRPLTGSEHEEYLGLIYSEEALSPEQLARLNELELIQFGGGQTEAEQAEFDALSQEVLRLNDETVVHEKYHRMRSLRSVRLGPSQVVFVIYPWRSGDEIGYETQVMFRLPNGTCPIVEAAIAEFNGIAADYERNHGQPYIPLRY